MSDPDRCLGLSSQQTQARSIHRTDLLQDLSTLQHLTRTCTDMLTETAPMTHHQIVLQAISSVACVLKPGGKILFRDYGVQDLAQHRLAGTGRPQKLADSFYLRMDGTKAFYFSQVCSFTLSWQATRLDVCQAVHIMRGDAACCVV